jgi:hypothetical protein
MAVTYPPVCHGQMRSDRLLFWKYDLNVQYGLNFRVLLTQASASKDYIDLFVSKFKFKIKINQHVNDLLNSWL